MADRNLKSLLLYPLGLAVIGGAAFGAYLLSHDKDVALAASRTALAETIARGPVVQVARVAEGPKERLIRLLADTRPTQSATLYGKVSGYVTSIAVDRGDTVKAGQVLATISSVETDQQYEAAKHDFENKERVWTRQRELVAHGWTSQQSADQAGTAYTMAQAVMAQNETLKSYEQIRAPFDGVVTARFVDVGALVQNSTTNKTSNQPVLTVADDSKLRVDVYVEQRDVPYIHVGDTADVADGANSARKVTAKITRTSGELDQRTRTLFVELEVDNTDHFLVPGSFAYVTLHVPVESYPEVPATGLVVRGTRTFIASIADDLTVHMLPVTVAHTDGTNASLSEGAAIGLRIALNPPDEIAEGSKVQLPPSSKR
ncbi:MAG TPA: efflux RND transporter periplasmic adaptor subunit [Stellaceae bacterium]|jgi:RND family efflux transporter MFP subunit